MSQKIIIQNSKKEKILGNLHLGSKRILLICCHGFRGSKDDFIIKNLSLFLEKSGYSSYRFNFSGQGKNQGFKNLDLIQEVKDICTVTAYFKKKYQKIILVGGSLGGLVSALAVLENSNIFALVTINGFFYLNKITWEYYKYILLTLLFFPFNKLSREIILYYFKKFKPWLIKVPTLVIYGDGDQIVSPDHSLRFYLSLKTNKTLKLIKNADHALTKIRYVNSAAKIITSWLKQYD